MQRKIMGFLSAIALSSITGCGTEEAASPDVIDLGNGEFQLKLDPAVGTKAPDWLGAGIEWEYIGQATYVRPSHPSVSHLPSELLKVDDGETSTLQRLLASTMEDDHGRLFRPKSVDMAQLRDAVDRYDKAVGTQFGDEDLMGDDRNDPASEGQYSPLAWARLDQNGDGNNDLFLWSGDDRNLISSPLTLRQKKAVIYFFGDIGSDAGHCTGVLVGDNWVMTAAHCVKNSAGTSWIYADGAGEARRGKVCTRGNFYAGSNCANVTGRWGNGSWGGTGDMGDDIVMMKIDENLGLGNFMAMSSASNSTLKDHDAFNLGYPGLTPAGGDNTFSCGLLFNGDPYPGDTADAVAPCESKMYWDSHDVTYTSSKVIGTRIDMSGGHSGGPIYYYPSGVSPTAAHYLTGIVSGHHNGLFEDYNGGAKVKYHRTWAIGIMNSN